LANFGVGADFAKNDGITMIDWRGVNDLHGTVECKAGTIFFYLSPSHLSFLFYF